MKFKILLIIILSTLTLGVAYTAHRLQPPMVQILTTTEKTRIIEELSTITNNENPKIALDKLSTLINKDPRILRECHEIVHEIGHAAYHKLGNFTMAVSFQNDICGSGYLHGIIEEKFGQTTDILTEVKTLCASHSNVVDLGKCYHGVGHGLMYYNGNNLPEAINGCNLLVSTSAKIRCAEGVYMENFGAEAPFHISTHLKPEDPLYPCANQPSQFQFSCYYYAPLYYLNLHTNNYKGALKLCLTIDTKFQSTCTKGVGSRIIKQNIQNLSFAQKMCESGTKDQLLHCLDGIISYYLVNYNSIEKAQQMCNMLKKKYRTYCRQSISVAGLLLTSPK